MGTITSSAEPDPGVCCTLAWLVGTRACSFGSWLDVAWAKNGKAIVTPSAQAAARQDRVE